MVGGEQFRIVSSRLGVGGERAVTAVRKEESETNGHEDNEAPGHGRPPPEPEWFYSRSIGPAGRNATKYAPANCAVLSGDAWPPLRTFPTESVFAMPWDVSWCRVYALLTLYKQFRLETVGRFFRPYNLE